MSLNSSIFFVLHPTPACKATRARRCPDSERSAAVRRIPVIEGLIQALSPQFMLWLTVGVLVGMIVGALPGLTATMGVALLVPFTFALPPGAGLAMLGALYVCAMFSDAIPAVLVNTPGTPAAMATAFDGHPMTLAGPRPGGDRRRLLQLGAGHASSAPPSISLLAWPLTTIALRFGPPEFFWIGVFALTIIGSLAGKSMLKGIAGGAIGMLISTIGISHTGAVSRFTFGIPELRGGVSLVAALIGVFAVPQVLSMVCERRKKEYIAEYTPQPGVALKTIREVITEPVHFLRSALIGTFVGILPGAGSPIAALLSYNEAVRWSKDKSQLRQGRPARRHRLGDRQQRLRAGLDDPAGDARRPRFGAGGGHSRRAHAARPQSRARTCSRATERWSTRSAGR